MKRSQLAVRLSKREAWKFHNRAAFERGFMRAQADACPVGGLLRVRKRIALLRERHREFMRQMRMTPAVSAALSEAEMCFLG